MDDHNQSVDHCSLWGEICFSHFRLSSKFLTFNANAMCPANVRIIII